jgi:tRNA uridine 5-carboxymethylaminomethyl modification enzyme
METKYFDVLIVGGGHAGVEAAHMAAQFPLKVGLLSMEGVPLGSAPCNPSVGGVGKGQVVREIDALGGLMGKLADLAGIQYRTLNESKGHALRSTRVQIDKEHYAVCAELELKSLANLEIIRSTVSKIEQLSVPMAEYPYQVLADPWSYRTKTLVLTTGTFLAGKLHCGPEVTIGGRVGSNQSSGLTSLLSEIKTTPARFKTGTPPRVNKNSLDFSKMEIQPSDDTVNNFHWSYGTTNEKTDGQSTRKRRQMPCYLTYTNAETLKIVRDNKEKSPMYNGQIVATGARYCPSLEDKAYRYIDKNIHHVFLEPEGLDLNTYYPSGISTSLPKEIQTAFLRTIPGLENAEIEQYGYAVEYDVVDTSQLDYTLQMREMPGLFFAGQVNGTSGYEEAAGQGLVAGLNAALKVQNREPIVLPRSQSYIGVMIEDLVTQKRDEPYRLFSARAENRLEMREDNSFTRMYEFRKLMNLQMPIDQFHEKRKSQVQMLDQLIKQTKLKGQENTVQEMLRNPAMDPIQQLYEILKQSGLSFQNDVLAEVAIGAKYEGYVAKEILESRRVQRPKVSSLNIEQILKSENISFECKHRISQFRPQTFEQLQRIPGLRPVTLAVIAADRL